MTINEQTWGFFDFLRAFFPLRLLVTHLKYNLFSLVFWALLFLIISDSLGYYFGIPLLFLSPEYLGSVSPWSFYVLGFALGGFTMGFNTYSYIKLGPNFPFLTSLSNPFFKFCINNSLIPLAFLITFIINASHFQYTEEFASISQIIGYNVALILGVCTFLVLSIFYFFPVAWRQEKRSGKSNQREFKPISSFIHRQDRWYDSYETGKDHIYLYIGKRLKLMQSRSVKHLDRKVVEQTFAKNKINASMFEIITICFFFLLGLLNKSDIMEVPAAVSFVLLLTIIQMLFSALRSWFNRWVYPLLIVVFIGMNYLSTRTNFFNYTNYAYGLNYELKAPDKYSIKRIQNISENKELNESTFDQYLQTLENWKKNTGEEKPKLVIINTSGGGSRSALWTLTVLQKTDEALEGKLSNHIQLITGASGGMVGAAYYRELLLRSKKKEIPNAWNIDYRKNISKDMLNKLSFMATTNDIFIRYQKYRYNGFKYTIDRGHAFEQQLHKNTKNLMKHDLGYYTPYEKKGIIPTMIFSPTIVNDGRRMLICSQRINFITENHGGPSKMTQSNENIEIHSLLAQQDVSKMRFSSVLRSSATFPFVMPMVTLPTSPAVQLMDAGIRDNYGGKTHMEFLHVMRDWIRENTSGVIILQVRDTKKVLDDELYHHVSLMDKITMPFGNIYKNFPKVQDFDQEELMKIGAQSFDFPIDLISFNLRESKKDRISLSWHLTKQEKQKIEEAFNSPLNQKAFEQLKRSL